MVLPYLGKTGLVTSDSIDLTSVTLASKYQNIFSAQTGSLKGIQASLSMHSDVTPKFLKPRSVPYALKPAIENDLERLENAGIIKQVTYSDWATPIVPVPKADGIL